MAQRYIAIVGSGGDDAETDLARAVGTAVADAGAVLVCGGLGGVMAAAAAGAQEAGGVTVGLLPGTARSAGNPHLTVAIPTGLGELRNGLVVRAADAVVAVGGGPGTLSEIAFALKTAVPVVSLGSWDVHDAIHQAPDPQGAVALALRLAVEGSAP